MFPILLRELLRFFALLAARLLLRPLILKVKELLAFELLQVVAQALEFLFFELHLPSLLVPDFLLLVLVGEPCR